MDNKLYYSVNGTPLNQNNYSQPNIQKKVMYRKPNIPDIDDTPSIQNVVNSNVVNNNLLNLPCNIYCTPLLVLVIVISLSLLCSLCCDIFKNKKLTIYTLYCVIVNVITVCIYTWLCKSCQLNNIIVKIVAKDILPWVIYVLLLCSVFLYISNRVIKK